MSKVLVVFCSICGMISNNGDLAVTSGRSFYQMGLSGVFGKDLDHQHNPTTIQIDYLKGLVVFKSAFMGESYSE